MKHPTIRRVVTGHDPGGKARVVDDRAVEPITSELMPGCAAYRLWGRDERPTLPDDGSPRRAEAYYPPRDGSRFMINIIAPGELVPPPDLDVAAALAELERLMPGAMAAMEPDAPGMHTTDSIDYVLVVSGEVTLELDDGNLTVLQAGDVVIQKRHPARLAQPQHRILHDRRRRHRCGPHPACIVQAGYTSARSGSSRTSAIRDCVSTRSRVASDANSRLRDRRGGSPFASRPGWDAGQARSKTNVSSHVVAP